MDELEVIFDIFHFKGVVGKFRRQSFESYFNTGSFIETLVNYAHTALTEFGKNFVAVHNQITDRKPAIRLPVAFPRHGHIVSSGTDMFPPRNNWFIYIIHKQFLKL